MLSFKRGDNLAIASPDRQILPVKTGNRCLPGVANFAGHSIEEYSVVTRLISKRLSKNAFLEKELNAQFKMHL